MIIQNNFNKNSADHLKDYQKIGRKENNDYNKGIEENLNNKVIQDIIHQDKEFDEDDHDDNDKWDFFR